MTALTVWKNHVVAVEVERDGPQEKAVLRRWDVTTGKPAEPIPLLVGPSLRAMVAADARTVLVRPYPDEESPTPVDDRWHIFSSATGKLVGKIPFDPGTQSVTAVGDFAYVVLRVLRGETETTPAELRRTLRAVEIKSGKVLWEHTLPNVGPPFSRGR
jgi:hypothetical protein